VPQWLAYSIISALFWGVWGFVSKLASNAMAPELNQILSTIGLMPVVFLILWKEKDEEMDEENPTDARLGALFGWATGLLGALGNLAYYAALKGGLTSVVTPLTALYPLFTVIAAMLLLRERLNFVQFIAIGIALYAVVALSGGWGGLKHIAQGNLLVSWMGYSLVALVLWGLTGLTQKLACNYISAERSYVSYVFAFFAVSLTLFFTQDLQWNLSEKDWFVGILGGILLGAGTLTSFIAYRSGGKAAIVTVLAALYPALTVLLAVSLLQEKLGLNETIGVVLSLLAGVTIVVEKRVSAPSESD
jgi:transporter family protein